MYLNHVYDLLRISTLNQNVLLLIKKVLKQVINDRPDLQAFL